MSDDAGRDDALVVRYLDGIASDDEVVALEQRLLRDDAARRTFVAFAHLHALLVDTVGDAVIASPRPRRRASRALAVMVAAAALVAVWVMRALAASDDGMPSVTACAATVSGQRDGQPLSLARGQRLRPRDSLRVPTEASVELAWANGDRVTAVGDSALAIASLPTETLRLDHGRLVITVAAHDAAVPFAIATDEAIVTDIGTEFAVERARGVTTVEVVSGTVRLATHDRAIDIPAGRSGIAAAGQPPRLIDADAPRAPSRPIAPAVTGAVSLPITAGEWADALPAGAVDGPSVDLVDWSVTATATVALTVDGGTRVARVVGRDEPQRELGRAPVPELRYFERRDLDAVGAIQLIEESTGRMWEIVRPEPRDGGDVRASALRELAAGTPRAPHALGGLLSMRDLERSSRHALAVSLPPSSAGPSPWIGQRVRLVGYPALRATTARADVAAAAVVDALTTHGAWVVGTADRPTLHVDPLVPEDLRAALARTLAQLAGSWRLVPPRDGSSNSF